MRIRSGCRALIQSKAPKATYTHCAAHQLNLAAVSACKVQAFRSAESTIGEIARFFKFSSKRQRLLDRALEETSSKPKKLKDSCRTRWIERVDSYIVFHELLPAVLMTLRAMVSPDNFKSLAAIGTGTVKLSPRQTDFFSAESPFLALF